MKYQTRRGKDVTVNTKLDLTSSSQAPPTSWFHTPSTTGSCLMATRSNSTNSKPTSSHSRSRVAIKVKNGGEKSTNQSRLQKHARWFLGLVVWKSQDCDFRLRLKSDKHSRLKSDKHQPSCPHPSGISHQGQLITCLSDKLSHISHLCISHVCISHLYQAISTASISTLVYLLSLWLLIFVACTYDVVCCESTVFPPSLFNYTQHSCLVTGGPWLYCTAVSQVFSLLVFQSWSRHRLYGALNFLLFALPGLKADTEALQSSGSSLMGKISIIDQLLQCESRLKPSLIHQVSVVHSVLSFN